MSGYSDMNTMESSRNCLRRIARHDELQFSKDSIVNVMERFVKTVNIMDETILVPCRLLDRQVGDSTDIGSGPGKDSTANQLSSTQGKRSLIHSKNVHEFLNSSDLFNLYTMLNCLKNDLLWTGKDENVDCDDDEHGSAQNSRGSVEEDGAEFVLAANVPNTESNSIGVIESRRGNTTMTANVKGHNRRPSNASVASTASVSNISDAESDTSNENDSGIELEAIKSSNLQNSDGSLSGSEDIVVHQKKGAANQDKATELARRCRRHLSGLYQCLEQMTEAANYLTARYQSDVGSV